jgi:hypothetical protein
MQRRTVQRAAFVLCVLAGVAALTVRKEVAAGTASKGGRRGHSTGPFRSFARNAGGVCESR